MKALLDRIRVWLYRLRTARQRRRRAKEGQTNYPLY